jgi:raffinose/stachyose/melibiose transport system permease protein
MSTATTASSTATSAPSQTPGKAPKARKSAYGKGGPLVYLIALLVVAITVGPVLYGAMGGFRTNAQLAKDPAGLPHPWVLSNYTGVLSNPDFWTYAFNSFAIALITTLVAVISGVMAAYPLAR